MKIHGWCEKCHKVRRVTVNSSGMVMLASGNVATGICDECQQEEDDRRRGHRGGRA